MEDFAAGGAWPGAVAVSGGGDSLALLHLAARWAGAAKKTAPLVLVVDHGLRPGSAGQGPPGAAGRTAIGTGGRIDPGAAPRYRSGPETRPGGPVHKALGLC